MSRHNFDVGVRVTAPNPKSNYEIHEGTVINNLSMMYFIEFANGQEDFVFKTEVEVEEI